MPNPMINPGVDSICIQVNGESKSCPVGTLLPAFLESLGLNPRLIALEYNGEILHRQLWATTRLHPNDRLEIVTIVGGG
jgi:sulfur carrier protein